MLRPMVLGFVGLIFSAIGSNAATFNFSFSNGFGDVGKQSEPPDCGGW